MVIVYQHVPFEGPGIIAEWAQARDRELQVVHSYRGDSVTPGADAAFLVVMGGPMSVNDTAEHPWIEPELDIIRQRIATDLPTLGVCLGAQLIAKACGSEIYKAEENEIGWYPVQRVTAEGLGQYLPEQFTPLHWHGETFDLPSQAVHLAQTDACPQQAFQVGRHVLGMQYHIEATYESVTALIEHCGHEIGDGPFEMPADEILTRMPGVEATLYPMLFAVLDALVAE